MIRYNYTLGNESHYLYLGCNSCLVDFV